MAPTFRRLALLLLAAAAAAVTAAAMGRAQARTPRCPTAHLVVSLEPRADATAGSVYYRLKLTNLSGHECTLRGFPGVSAVTIGRKRIGRPALRSASAVRTVTLRQAASAMAVVRIADAQNYPVSRCRPTIAAGLRVYPPGDTAAKVVPFVFRACRRLAVSTLAVQAVRPIRP